MGEKHHGTQSFFLLSQFAERLTEHLDQLLQRGKHAIVQVFLAQFLPQMLDGVDFWTLSWLKDQANILRDLQIFGPVPCSLIDLHDDKIVGKVSGRASARKRFIIAVSARGRMREVIKPCSGATAAET
jgi:hypothetical protein